MARIFNYEVPDWSALERALELAGGGNVEAPPVHEAMGDYMWMCEHPKGVHQYKHRDTRNYANLRIDSTPEQCAEEIRKALSCERTWGAAMDQRLAVAR